MPSRVPSSRTQSLNACPAVFRRLAGLGLETRIGGLCLEGAGVAGMTRGSPTQPGTSRAPGGQGNFTPTRGRAWPPLTLGAQSAPSSRPFPSSCPSLSSPLRRLEAAGPGGAAQRSPQPRAPAPPPRPAGRAAEPGLGTSFRGAARGMKLGARGSRSGGTAQSGAARV